MKLGSRRIHAGRIFDLDLDTVRFPDGSEGEFEIVRHSGAAAVVPVLEGGTTANPQILLIRQFRYAADGPIWEIPAGRLDPGESPEQCALRELAEEAGLAAGRLQRLTTIYSSPGFSDERIHLFAAHDLSLVAPRLEPDEFLETHAVPLSQALAMIEGGELADAKSVAALFYFSRFGLGL